MSSRTMRLDRLEQALMPNRSGGVLFFDSDVETAEQRVARAPPGAYIVVPAPISDEKWQTAARASQQRLLVRAAAVARGEPDPGPTVMTGGL